MKKNISTAPTATTTALKETPPDNGKSVDLDKVKHLLDGLSLYGRRERIPHSDLCKKLKESGSAQLIESSLGKGA